MYRGSGRGEEKMTRHVSDDGIKELEEMEGVEPYVYTCSANHQTIGVGHKITEHELKSGILIIDGQSVKWIEGLNKEQIDKLLRQDISNAEKVVNDCIHVSLNDHQFDALCSLCFNIGETAFRSSSVVAAINRGDFFLVPGLMRLWNKVTKNVVQEDGSIKRVKTVSQGLVKRREREILLWNKGVRL
jgi:GH24 family phage-related lysozyme (muramidase)